MKKILLPVFLFLIYVTGSSIAFADVRLPAILGSHMVLQQESHVKIWGWCDPAEKIKVSSNWDTATYSTAGSDHAKWSVEIKTPAPGGPFKITINGNNTVVLEDV